MGRSFPAKNWDQVKKLDRRIVKTVRHMSKYFGDILMGLPRVIGVTPEQMVDFGLSKERIRQLGRFTPEELMKAGLVDLKIN